MNDNVLFIDWAAFLDLAHDRGRYARWRVWQCIAWTPKAGLSCYVAD